jgi:hypothetical protein
MQEKIQAGNERLKKENRQINHENRVLKMKHVNDLTQLPVVLLNRSAMLCILKIMVYYPNIILLK